MGDRVVIQFKTAKGEVSPVIYGHWADAGCFVVTVGATWHVRQFNGYAPTIPDAPGISWECVAPA